MNAHSFSLVFPLVFIVRVVFCFTLVISLLRNVLKSSWQFSHLLNHVSEDSTFVTQQEERMVELLHLTPVQHLKISLYSIWEFRIIPLVEICSDVRYAVY